MPNTSWIDEELLAESDVADGHAQIDSATTAAGDLEEFTRRSPVAAVGDGGSWE